MCNSTLKSKKIRVLCVDDSALVRAILTRIIDDQPDMEVVGVAPNPLIARQKIKELNPDVLTLDVEMPLMDGLDFLERMMRLRPMPVVMISSLTARNSEISMRALALGAVDVIAKPTNLGMQTPGEYGAYIAERIRAASVSKLQNTRQIPSNAADSSSFFKQPSSLAFGKRRNWLIAIGASTGGTEAITRVVSPLPAMCPPIVIAQHMPAGFTRSFAQRLNKLCQLSVKEAEDGDLIQPGHAYLAPGGEAHMTVSRTALGALVVRLTESAPVSGHRPSVDVLFDSVAKVMGKSATGVLLTGMGRDGAQGLKCMREQGADTLAQDEATSVVFGMPREALAIGATLEAVPIDQISQRIFTPVV